jgi:hypothetical protein
MLTDLNLADFSRTRKDSREATPEDEEMPEKPTGPHLRGGSPVEPWPFGSHQERNISLGRRVVVPKRAPSPPFRRSHDTMDNIERMIERLKAREASKEPSYSSSLGWEMRMISQEVTRPISGLIGYIACLRTDRSIDFTFFRSRRDELLPVVQETVDEFGPIAKEIAQRMANSDADQLGAFVEARDLLATHLKTWEKLYSDFKDLFACEKKAKKAQKVLEQQAAAKLRKLARANQKSVSGASGAETGIAGVQRKQCEQGSIGGGSSVITNEAGGEVPAISDAAIKLNGASPPLAPRNPPLGVMDKIEKMIKKLSDRETSKEQSPNLDSELSRISQQILSPMGRLKNYEISLTKSEFTFFHSRHKELLSAVREVIDQSESKLKDLSRRICRLKDRLRSFIEARDFLSTHLKDWEKILSECKDIFACERKAKRAQKRDPLVDHANSAPGLGTSGEGMALAGIKRKQLEDGEIDEDLMEQEVSKNKKSKKANLATTPQTRLAINVS